MHSINFNLYDHNFCESTIYSTIQHPEYLNSLSSLFIAFIGFNGLTKPCIHFQLALLYSAFIVNGITSSFYHYYNTIGWGLLDRMSMILIALSSVGLFLNYINRILILNRWKRRHAIIISRLINLLVQIYFTVLFTVAGLHIEQLFNIMFGIFLGSLVLFMITIEKCYYEMDLPYKLVKMGWNGIVYIATSGIFWILTENLCNDYFFIKYLLGHVWWHLFVSYGGYLISLIPCYLYLQNLNIRNIVILYDIFGIPYLYNNYDSYV